MQIVENLDTNCEVDFSLPFESMETDITVGFHVVVSIESKVRLSSEWFVLDLLKTKAYETVKTASKIIRLDVKLIRVFAIDKLKGYYK